MEIVTRKEAKEKGLVRYFQGSTCSNGHRSERFTTNGWCVDCASVASASQEKKEYDKEYCQKNAEKKKQQGKARYKRSRERCMAQAKKWHDEHPLHTRASKMSYKIRQKNGVPEVMSRIRLCNWLIAQDMSCKWCGKDCSDEFEIDHIIPLSKGGPHVESNLAISCHDCNYEKRAQMPDKFLKSRSEVES
jgi:5-methylcytosine-specific restriction endonuclease McrA